MRESLSELLEKKGHAMVAHVLFYPLGLGLLLWLGGILDE
jgi:hypothetical protein